MHRVRRILIKLYYTTRYALCSMLYAKQTYIMDIPLYIHIPFCRKKCNYCDFYSIEYNYGLAKAYIDLIISQIKPYESRGYQFKTVFIGGGTPSVLDRGLLAQLLKNIDFSFAEEVTIEANPESLDIDKLSLIRELGVNRLSIGVQSFDDDTLKFLGRLHSGRQALNAVELAANSGFKNISIDLIFAVPSQRLKSWKDELDLAVKQPIQHISAYSLTYESGTPLYKRLQNKEFKPVSSDTEAGIYGYAIDFLESRGFNQYEISNFAKPGFECKHNLSYWSNSPYIGLGPAAVTYIGGERKKYIGDIYIYIDKLRQNKEEGLFIERESLSVLQKAKETAVLNIRRKQGVDFGEFKENTGFNFLQIYKSDVDKLVDEKVVEFKKNNGSVYGARLTKKGFFLADYVCRQLL